MKSLGSFSFILVLIVAMAASVFTIWLLDSTIKYALYIFQAGLTMVLYLVLSNYNIKLRFKSAFKRPNLSLIPDLLLIVVSLTLIFSVVTDLQGGLMQLAIAMVATTFFTGYALLNLLGVKEYFSNLELLVISYVVGFTFNGFLFLSLLSLGQFTRPIIVCIVLFFLGICSATKHLKRLTRTSRRSLSKPIDALPLMTSVIFYIIAFFFMYPNFTLLSGMDISRHYANSVVLSRTPSLYVGSIYLLHNSYLACLLSLSDVAATFFQSSIVLFNLMLPLAFYVMAKEYLEKLDSRLPSLATVFWSVFTSGLGGFSWIYFVHLKLNPTQSQLQLLWTTADKTIFGTIYGVFGLWFAPVSVTFTMLFVSFFLLRKVGIPKAKYMVLFSVLVIATCLTHITEAILLSLFLSLYGIFSQEKSIRLRDALKASAIGFLTVLFISFIALPLIFVRFSLNPSQVISVILPLTALVSSLTLRRINRLHAGWRYVRLLFARKHLTRVSTTCLISLYIVGILTYVVSVGAFHASQVHEAGVVPWFFFPLMLGVNGLLALITIAYMVKDRILYQTLALFVAFILFTFITGRTISIINVNFFDTCYWERRLLWLMHIGTSILAPIPIVKSISHLKRASYRPFVKTLGTVLIIATVVLYGISTSFLNLDFWNITTDQGVFFSSNRKASELEQEALRYLSSVLDRDSHSWLVTVTSTSFHMADFAAPADKLFRRNMLFAANGTELPLWLLYRASVYSHAYLYMHTRDFQWLQRYGDRYLTEYLIPMLPAIFKNQEVTIYNVSKLVPSSPNSDAILVIPLDETIADHKGLSLSYDLLSQGLYNYTVAYDLDDKIVEAKHLILSFDPPRNNIVTQNLRDDFNLPENIWTQISGEWIIREGKLAGGEYGRHDEGILILPISAQNFTVSFKVKPVTGDPNVLSHVSLIYSWQNARNFRYVDIMFSTEGYIYTMFCLIENGNMEVSPPLPGNNTSIRWSFGNEYDFTVLVNGTLNEVFINGKKCLTANFENVGGKMGLRYFKFYSVTFEYFHVEWSSQATLREYEDYMDFLSAGGRVTVLNTHGFGAFAEDLLEISNKTLTTENIKGVVKDLTLPAEVETPIISVKSDDVKALAYYVSSSTDISVFIANKDIGNGQLVYVNVHPIVSLMIHDADKRPMFYNLLGSLLKTVNLNLTEFQPDAFPNPEASFREVHIDGNVTIKSPSILFPLRASIKRVDVTVNDEHLTFHNITSLSFNNYEGMTIIAANVHIGEGKGFYATLFMNDTIRLRATGENATLMLRSDADEINANNFVNASLTTDQPIKIYVRTPTVDATGDILFKELYSETGSLRWLTRTYGQDLGVIGNTNFSIFLSDNYTLVNNFNIIGPFERNPPILMYDEWSTLSTAVFWGLILLPIFLGIARLTSDKARTVTRK